MKKTSKILSLLVALCMAVTMLSGLTVMAADPFELVSYDADADFITLDFNQAIDTVNSTIVLKKGDEFVDFTIAKADMNSNVQSTSAERYSYKITLDDGIVLGDEYKISFWDVKSSDGLSTLAQSAMTFTVNEIGDQADLANFYATTYTTAMKWTKDAATGVLTKDEAFITPKTSSNNNLNYYGFAGALIGADNNGTNALPTTKATTGSGTWTETDYTIKVTFKSDERLTSSNIYFGIGRNLTAINGGKSPTDITAIRLTGSAYAATAQKPAVTIYNGAPYNSGGSHVPLKTLAATNVDALDYTAGIELKFSSKDGFIRGFVNGGKVIDLEADAVAGYPFFSIRNLTGAEYTYIDETTQTETTAKYGATDLSLYGFQATQSTFAAAAEVDAPEGYIPPEPDEEEAPAAILDWNADLDFFTVDFAEEIASMDATITQADDIIPASVYLANSSTLDPANAARCTWIVKPAAGFTRDIPYTVSIANVKDAEGATVLSTWSKTFKVEVIDEGITYPGNPSTKTNHYTAASTLTQFGEDGLKFSLDGTKGFASKFAYAIGDDTNATKAIGSASSAPNAVYTVPEDYTVKATFKIGGASAAKIGIAHTYSVNTSYTYDHGWFRGVGAYVNVWAGKADAETGITPIGTTGSLQMYSTKYIDSAAKKIIREQNADSANKNLTGLTPTTGIELKLSMKNDSTNFYINGMKSADITTYGETERGCFAIHAATSGNSIENSWIEVTDIVFTRATHLDVTGASFTYDEATVDEGAIAGQETVNIILPVINNTLATKALFAVCAIYDATGAMKNIVISTVDEATSGNNEVTFENVAVNGGTYAKIFLWDSAAALNPWFPAIEVE